jgi:glycosyltransferase involved in cell wall biosynthesis
MRLGLIARADSRGLGIQTKAFHDNLHPTKTMVVDCPSANPLPIRRDWYPGATWINGLPTVTDLRAWLAGLDVVYTAETGYSKALWTEARRAGVKTVLHANYEFLDRTDTPSLWAAPSLWHIDDFPAARLHLPVPIDTRRFDFHETSRPDSDIARRFLHIVGRPAIHDRNGTADLIAALEHVTARIRVTIKCQDPHYVRPLLRKARIPANVEIFASAGDTENYWDNYRGHDVMVMPRRFGGLCLPAQEAIGAGMPVIMPNISPNNTWLPPEWLTPAQHVGSFTARQRIDYYNTDPQALAALIDRIATDQEFYTAARNTASALRQELSWDTLAPLYRDTLANA